MSSDRSDDVSSEETSEDVTEQPADFQTGVDHTRKRNAAKLAELGISPPPKAAATGTRALRQHAKPTTAGPSRRSSRPGVAATTARLREAANVEASGPGASDEMMASASGDGDEEEEEATSSSGPGEGGSGSEGGSPGYESDGFEMLEEGEAAPGPGPSSVAAAGKRKRAAPAAARGPPKAKAKGSGTAAAARGAQAGGARQAKAAVLPPSESEVGDMFKMMIMAEQQQQQGQGTYVTKEHVRAVSAKLNITEIDDMMIDNMFEFVAEVCGTEGEGGEDGRISLAGFGKLCTALFAGKPAAAAAGRRAA